MESSTETALARTEPSSQRAIILAESLKADAEQRQLLGQYIHQHMREGTDFGKIPGTEKPTLLKPGAEKLVDLFRCTPQFRLMKSDEDFDKGFFNYMFRARLVARDSGAVLAEGFGSANSREGRYRWRNANRVCPNCRKETILKGKAEYGGGWLCWAKKGGCGAKFNDGDSSIEGQPAGKVENDDIATMANTILKMAKKRALVDGSIALARCSDMFTQDVEDFADAEPAGPAATAPAAAPRADPKPQPAAPAPAPAAEKKTGKEMVADKARTARVRRIWERAKLAGMDEAGFRAWVDKIGRAHV